MNKRIRKKICKYVCTGKPSRYIGNLLKKGYAVGKFTYRTKHYAYAMTYLSELAIWYRITKILDAPKDGFVYIPIEEGSPASIPDAILGNDTVVSEWPLAGKYQINNCKEDGEN